MTATTTRRKAKCKCGHEQTVTTKAIKTTCSMCYEKIPLRALSVVMMLSMLVIISGMSTADAYAEISVRQDNLTVQEQQTLDKIAQARADGTCEDKLCLPFTANVISQKTIREVTVPHIISGFDSGQDPCQTQWDGFVPVTVCIFRGVAPDGSEAIWDYEDEKWTSELILEQEAKEAYDEYVAEQLEAEKPYWQTVSERLPDEPTNTADRTLKDKINQLLSTEGSACLQGVGTTSGTQHKRAVTMPIVEVPVYVTNINGDQVKTSQTQWVLDETMPLSNVELRGFLGTIYTDMRECAAQMVLNDDQGGIMSSVNTVFGNCDENEGIFNIEESIANHCGVSAGAYYNSLNEKLVPWSQSRTNQEANLVQSLDPVNPMCTSYNSDATKRDYGCIIPQRDYESNQTAPEPKEIGAEIEAKVNQYMLDDGASMKQDIIDKIREDNYERLK